MKQFQENMTIFYLSLIKWLKLSSYSSKHQSEDAMLGIVDTTGQVAMGASGRGWCEPFGQTRHGAPSLWVAGLVAGHTLASQGVRESVRAPVEHVKRAAG